ncbi:hypothetical protein EI71_00444 [Anaeroplasma bactoclasticum]|jgi:uncharacterized membrane protein|uniref:DUF4870 domain-containing protein n=1 Tax=Anaeroplasma bactoclasticum TaxID=2088 RepID=A0A397RXX7_9MOLU|nr:hypothetical protein [Anaeroplasma bactoclasticum]RIA78132.1 hypothetical protein EI71_00444 [Anaeroplasma bactoclasticum]
MEEKRFIGMTPNVVFGLTWLLFPFGIVALAVDHDKMTKNDKQQIVSAFVLEALSAIISIIFSIVDAIIVASTNGAVTWVPLLGLVFYVPIFVFWLISMIQAFRGIEFHCPIAWSIAGGFVHEGKADQAETKEEPKAEEPKAEEENKEE